ncbi:hypothetical protein ASD71_04000 [Achromobacter sp. Root565]|nr:hypothetical protein ASD71_04000 [Achromobacter sp. Root565]
MAVAEPVGSQLDVLLRRGVFQSLRYALDCDALSAKLREQPADLILCEITATSCEGLLVSARLARESSVGGLGQVPTILWVSELPLCALESYAAELRLKGADIQIARSVEAIEESLSQNREPQMPVENGESLARFSDEDLIRALGPKDGIRVVLQPQIDLSSGKLIGAEALARWHHPVAGHVPPLEFVDALDRLSMEPLFFHMVTERVFEAQAVLCEYGGPLRMSVNVSAPVLAMPGVTRSLEERCHRHGISPSLVTVEITENKTMDEKTLLEAGVHRLRSCGFGLSMDDFGTGASTLERLSRLPFNEIKIDRSFVQRIFHDSTSRAIVTVAIDLGRSLDMTVIAEGIETRDQARELMGLGCGVGQGFGLGRPMEVPDFISTVRAFHAS